MARMETFGKYIHSLFDGWVGVMSALALVLLFLPSTFPDKYRWCVWLASGVCFLIANFVVWRRESLRADIAEEKLTEIEEAKPRIILREPNAIHVEPIHIEHRMSGVPGHWKTVSFVKVRFVNNPPNSYPSSVAGCPALVPAPFAGTGWGFSFSFIPSLSHRTRQGWGHPM